MRIVYYTHTAFFEVALSLLRELSQLAEVHVVMEVSPTSWRAASFDVPPLNAHSGLIEADGVLRDRFPVAVRSYWQNAASFYLLVHPSRRSVHWDSWRIGREALRYFDSLSPDVLHVDDVDVSLRLPLVLPMMRRVPIVLSAHDPEPHSGERNWRKRMSRRLSYPKASRFILHNGRLRPMFCRRYRIPPEIVDVVRLAPLDILQEWVEEPVVEREPTVLFFGRLGPYKGLETLYAAATHVASKVPGVRFVVAGRPLPGYELPPPPSLPASARIIVIDEYVPAVQLARLLREATVVACPYLDATQSAVILAAYGFRKPVVATAVGGLREYVTEGRTGFLVPPGDAQALAEALIRILQEPGLRDRMRSGIVAEMDRRLNWSRAARETLGVYGAATGTQRAAGTVDV